MELNIKKKMLLHLLFVVLHTFLFTLQYRKIIADPIQKAVALNYTYVTK